MSVVWCFYVSDLTIYTVHHSTTKVHESPITFT